MKKLTYKDAPHDWAICFQDDCPRRERCLRHAVALLAPPALTHHATVLPAAREGDPCSLFATAEPVRLARGMKGIMQGVPKGQTTDIRQGLYGIFSSCPHFYRYRRGDYDITPEQQERVAALFRKHGITTEPHYDKTTIDYYFPNEKKTATT
ncbi:MAG: hypothetical protein IJ700_03565 [Bacteroidaceae bacterium]|nr:hypothetical protein [Bacteroidaceae bacterium]